jgi:hypothetical protein
MAWMVMRKKSSGVVAEWAGHEVATVDCGDARLNKRLVKLLSDLGKSPGASIAQSCHGGHAEIAAAYRFFDHPAATPQAILAAHQEQTRRRMESEATVLLVQDTTEIDMTQPQRRVQGAGPLDGSARQGALLHLLAAFSTQGVPLGSVWSKCIVRQAAARPKPTRLERNRASIASKESVRWLEGLAQAHVLAQEDPKRQVICLADSEADIYEYLQEAQGAASAAHCSLARADWIVRACQKRNVQRRGQEVQELWAACLAVAPRFEQEVQVRGRPAPLVQSDKRSRRQPREDRDITVAVRACSLNIQPPQRKSGPHAALRLNAVLVSEMDPPKGEVAVEWLLLSSLPIQNNAQVRRIVESYAKRFMIEVFFRVLKSGCRIEERRFETCARHLSHLAVSLIVAWRVMWLAQLGQHQGHTPASRIFEPGEWQGAWVAVHPAKPLPQKPPNMAEMIELVGRLGGWMKRSGKYASPPGVQTLWQGMRRLNDLTIAWNAASKIYV